MIGNLMDQIALLMKQFVWIIFLIYATMKIIDMIVVIWEDYLDNKRGGK